MDNQGSGENEENKKRERGKKKEEGEEGRNSQSKPGCLEIFPAAGMEGEQRVAETKARSMRWLVWIIKKPLSSRHFPPSNMSLINYISISTDYAPLPNLYLPGFLFN